MASVNRNLNSYDNPEIIRIDFYDGYEITRCLVTDKDEYILKFGNGLKKIISGQNKFDIDRAYSMFTSGQSQHHIVQLALFDRGNPFGQFTDTSNDHMMRNEKARQEQIQIDRLVINKRKKLLLL